MGERHIDVWERSMHPPIGWRIVDTFKVDAVPFRANAGAPVSFVEHDTSETACAEGNPGEGR